jgi:hypothetical protein
LSSTAAGVRTWIAPPTGGGTDDQTAAEVPFTPNGSISATNVQAAIQEVRDEAGGGESAVSSVFGRTGTVTSQAGDYTPAQVGAEPTLGNPTTDGYVLSSTAAGVRSWIAPASGGSSTWLSLTDTPSSFTANYYVKVN